MAEVHVRNNEQFTEELRRAEKHIARRDPLLRAVIKKTGPCSIRPHHRHFEILARSIISQQLSTRVADTIGKTEGAQHACQVSDGTHNNCYR